MSLAKFRKFPAISLRLSASWSFSSRSATLMTQTLDLLQSQSLRGSVHFISVCVLRCSEWVLYSVPSSSSPVLFCITPFCHWTQSLCFVLLFFSGLKFLFFISFIYLLRILISSLRLFFTCLKYVPNCLLKHF